MLWAGEAGFGGVLAIRCGDLIVLPPHDAHRRCFGWRMAAFRMAAFVAGLFFATMAIPAAAVELAFTALGLVPSHHANLRAQPTSLSLKYSFWLDLLSGALALYLVRVTRQSCFRSPWLAASALVHRTKQMVHHLFGASRCTAPELVGRLVQTDESSVWVGPLAFCFRVQLHAIR